MYAHLKEFAQRPPALCRFPPLQIRDRRTAGGRSRSRRNVGARSGSYGQGSLWNDAPCTRMKHLLILPLLAAAALLTGCAVEPAYVDGGPTRIYASGPGYYAPEPVYGGSTTVIAVDRDRGRDRYDRGDRDGRDRARMSDRRRSSSVRDQGRGRAQAGYDQRGGSREGRNIGKRQAGRRGPATAPRPGAQQKKDGKKRDRS